MKLLIIEDNIQLARTIKKGLELEKYTVDIAHNGKEGLLKAVANQCDLVILDWMMPEMNGIEFLNTFRKDNLTTPVLMLTAKDTSFDTIESLDNGADDYLAKPFDFDVLLARIRSLLRRSTTKELLLSCGSLTIDPKTKHVERSGVSIKLSAKEYRLAEYLIRHKGEVLGEEDIVTHGWSYEYDSMSNIVRVYIRYLRNKIDRAFPNEQALIQTIRGMGYTMSDTSRS